MSEMARNGGDPPARRHAMKPVMLKACTRCSGDMALGNDYEVGLYATCLQCGHVEDIQRKPSTRESRLPDGKRSRRTVKAA